MASSSADRMVWYQIGEHVDHVHVKSGALVSEVRDAIKQKNQRKLGNVDAIDITIKTSIDGEALNPMRAIPQQDKDKDELPIPFYVMYEQPSTSAGSTDEQQVPVVLQQIATRQEQMVTRQEKMVTQLEQMKKHQGALMNELYGVVPGDVRTMDVATVVSNKCTHHHGTPLCLVLLSFSEATAQWYRDTVCTAHLYPKKKANVAPSLGIDIDDGPNTMKLLRHIELELDAGRLVFIPEALTQNDLNKKRKFGTLPNKLKLRIFVQEQLKQVEVWEVKIDSTNTKQWLRPVTKSQGEGWVRMHFSDLHDHIFEASPVYMRSLFELARGAHNHVDGMPNPETFLERFEERCGSWVEFIQQRFTGVGTSIALQDVDVEREASPKRRRTSAS